MVRSVRRLFSCISVATMLWLPACSSPEQRFAEHVARAERHAAHGRVPEALLEYQSALGIDPQNASLHLQVGDLLSSLREYNDAISYYRKAFELDPELLAAAMNEARLLAFSDPKRAGELVQHALERWAERSDVQVTRSYVALASGDIEEALRAADRAVELEPASSSAWTQAGKVYQARIRTHRLNRTLAPPKVFQSALEAFARVDQIEGGDARARVERARILESWGGRQTEVLEAYRAALDTAKGKGDGEGRLVAARAFDDFAKKQHDNPLRRESLREIVDADEDDYESWDRLTRLADGQRLPRGEAVCLELIAKRPDDPRSHRVYANYLLRKRRPADAIAHLRNVTASGGKAPQLWEQLITLQIRNNQLADAHATFDDLADAFPDNPATLASEAHLALAAGRFADAAKILRALVKTHETSEYQRLLAITEQKLGVDLLAAVAASNRALALDPTSPERYRLKARTHFDARQWTQVIFAYRALTAVGRQLSPSEELRRAIALYESGNVAAGRSVLDQILAEAQPPPAAAIEYARREGRANYEAARRALLAASMRAPNDPRLFDALLELEIAVGHADSALAQIDAAVAGGRARPRLLLLRAQILVSLGKLASAEAEILRLFAAVPTQPGAAELLFDIYRRQKRIPEAQRSFEQAEAAGLLHPGTRLLLARLQFDQGEFEKAQQVLETVVVEQPELVSARNDLAFVLASRGDQLERALELAQSARRALGDHPAAIDTVGYVHLQAGRHAEALAEFQRAIALTEARPEGVAPAYRYHLGLALEALGRKPEAADAFERALGSPDEFSEAEDARRRLESARASPTSDADAS